MEEEWGEVEEEVESDTGTEEEDAEAESGAEMVGSVVEGAGTLVEGKKVAADPAAMERGESQTGKRKQEYWWYMQLMQVSHLMQFVVQATPTEQLSDHLDISFLSMCR